MDKIQFINLCSYALNSSANATYLFANLASFKQLNLHIRDVRTQYPFNIFIVDCCDYYSDDDIVAISNLITKKKPCMNDYMNTSITIDDTLIDTPTSTLLKTWNIVFVLNIQSTKEACKNIIPFMNSLFERKLEKVHFFFTSCCEESEHLKCNFDFEYTDADFLLLFPDVISSSSSKTLPTVKVFKNYKALSKFKKDIFPLNKLRITKKRTERYISNIIFIDKFNDDTEKCGTENYYKTIIIDYLTNDCFNYTSLFGMSHYENIPLILYENSKLIISAHQCGRKSTLACKDHIIRKIVTGTRQLCIDYYCHSNDPDMHLFEKSNMYYFLHMYKKLISELKAPLNVSKLNKLSFTKYYSNRAAEIQYQKTFSIFDE